MSFVFVTEIMKRIFFDFFCQGARLSLANLTGESPVMEGEPIPPCSEFCAIVGNEYGEA